MSCCILTAIPFAIRTKIGGNSFFFFLKKNVLPKWKRKKKKEIWKRCAKRRGILGWNHAYFFLLTITLCFFSFSYITGHNGVRDWVVGSLQSCIRQCVLGQHRDGSHDRTRTSRQSTAALYQQSKTSSALLSFINIWSSFYTTSSISHL